MGEGKEQKAKVLLGVGVLLVLAGISADFIGLGGGAGYGLKQISIIVLGAVLIFVSKKCCGCCSKKADSKTN